MERNRGNKRIQVRVVRRFKDGWLCAEAVAAKRKENDNKGGTPGQTARRDGTLLSLLNSPPLFWLFRLWFLIDH